MKVTELIEKLNELPPDMEVMIDHTKEGSQLFKFVELNWCDQVSTSLNEDIVLLSANEYEITEEDQNPNF